VGKQPLVDQKQRGRERRTVLGAVDYRTGQMVLDVQAHGNTQTFINHLENLDGVYIAKNKIILVLDNVKFHHSNAVAQWIDDHPKFEVLYLPPYSPQLNPIERVWWYMRKSVTHNRFVESMECRLEKFSHFFRYFMKPNETIKKICVTNF
jgi:transposase